MGAAGGGSATPPPPPRDGGTAGDGQPGSAGDHPAGPRHRYAAGDADPTAPALAGLIDLVPVGRGGDSTVYRAHQVSPDRDVAVKVLDLTSSDDLRRFEREVRITVQLGRLHPNIMKVLDTRRFADGRPCIVMDFYEMGSTHDRLQATGPFSVADVVTIGRVICDALGFAHSRKVLHRDVKPQNILILPTSYVLADFGIARPMDAGHTSSLDRLSYRHASPEVLDGRQPEATDDLWSLGSTLHTLLTGRAPFAADDPADDTPLAYLRRVRLGQRRPLPDDVPAALRTVIDRAMAPGRGDRYHTAAEMLSDLHMLDREVDAWAPGGSANAEGGDGLSPATPESDAPHESATEVPAPATDPAPAPGSGPAADAELDDEAWWAPDVSPSAASSLGESASGTAVGREPAGPSAEPAGEPHAAHGSPADLLAGIAPSVAGSLAGAVAGSLAGSLAGSPNPDATDAAGLDAAPTGLHPGADATRGDGSGNSESRGSAGSGGSQTAGTPSPAGDGPSGPATPPRVRTRIIVLAGAMLVVSALVAYLIARPTTPTTITPPPASGSAAVSETVTGSPRSSSGEPLASSGMPVAGGDLSLDDPQLRPSLLSVTIHGNLITVTFSAASTDIAHVMLVDVTHHNIPANTGPVVPLGTSDASSGRITGTLPAQDDADSVISVVLVGSSSDFSQRGVSEVRAATR